MPKATIEYNLENHDDRMAMNRAIKSTEMALALFQFTTNLRKECEQKMESIEDEKDLDVAHRVIDYIFTRIHEEVEVNGIVLADLIE